MSIRIATATTPALLSITDGPMLQLRRSEHKTKSTVAIAMLAAAALVANIADAAASNHNRHSAVSTPRSSWVAHYTPSDNGGNDHGVSAWSCVRPSEGDGAYPDILADMLYHRYDKC
ncbi:hypothetical protein [Rhodoblastus sp.]|jgi:hypothetical protein|uniref:hypothetical protein n=1 Tax=Rhodoblastus sp. TaxID=1962975 RepID=UPI0025D77007|nr:hypothetical protein [Rhodoblastus sp.]